MRRSNKVKRSKLWGMAACCLMALVIIGGCSSDTGSEVNAKPPNHVEAERYQPVSVSLVAVGDLLMHNTVIKSGEQADGGYNYDYLYAPIEPILAEADYSWVTMECTLAGPEYTGYPLFNSPDELAASFKKSGFDLIVTSNNHCLDRGEKGALRTLDVLREQGLDTIGTYKSAEEFRQFLIKDLKGIKVGFLSYTYDTNGIPIPDDVWVSMMDHDKIMADIGELSPQVDFLVVIMHWGEEYGTYPTSEQQEWAEEFLESGADAIIGSHVHVVQPDQEMEIDGKKKYVIYSLGNSLGNQNGIDRNSGVIARLNITKPEKDGRAVLESVDTIPSYSQIYSEDGERRYHTIDLESTIDALENGDYDANQGSESLGELKSIARDIRDRLAEMD